MEGGPPIFNPGSTSPSLFEGYGATSCYRAFTVFGRAFQRVHRLTPIRFRSPLLTESLLLSFPPGTEMFQFPGFASPTYAFST